MFTSDRSTGAEITASAGTGSGRDGAGLPGACLRWARYQTGGGGASGRSREAGNLRDLLDSKLVEARTLKRAVMGPG